MSDRTITVTLKAGVGFDAPWVVIGGDQIEEVNFKLDQILGAGTLQKAAAVAIAFHNGYRDLRHRDGSYDSGPPQETYSQPPVGSRPVDQQPPPQQDPWASQPPPAQDPWANQGPPPAWAQGGQQTQQQPPQQQQGGGRPPVCRCGKAMEFKTTGASQKPVWRCPDWRWNNGNPTPNHDQIWVEGNR